MNYPKLASVRSASELRSRLEGLGCPLPVADGGPWTALSRPLTGVPGLPRALGNRLAILPMEGWDGTADGHPTDLVRRRWRRFGESGAKLVWGGEAVAVRHDGRANPRQLMAGEGHVDGLAELRRLLVEAHAAHGSTDDLWVGLQLTHSGRWSRPNDSRKPEPRVAFRHPLLDPRVGVTDDALVLTDAELDGLVEDFVRAATRAWKAGFDFVDVKHCHGYLGHELLGARVRPGAYGGSLANRTRFLRLIVEGIRRDAPGLGVGVRLSLFDRLPHRKGPGDVGEPEPWAGPYLHGFGCDPADPSRTSWDEPLDFLRMLEAMGVRWVCLTAGSPYYNPHIQRPAMVPPSDGYLPPEDPLVGVARQVEAVARAKAAVPGLVMVGSAYSYLQEWLPHVGEAQVAAGRVDVVGLGRSVLSYPELTRDLVSGRPMDRRRVCRTFSECTTGPRNGLVSGCFPLDDFYKRHPDAERLRAAMGR
ncbi:MAG: NADH:flavin oxidoreductase [Verrucomicrobiota bacterium]|jgi:2,4-dienoyl-CoA reductase-like NADH-dependent reductase (Old Yellow Enzyme family)